MTTPEPGSDMQHPQVIDRASLDLSGLRAHIAEHHSYDKARGGLPRVNVDLAAWHARQHHRYRTGHSHFGPFVLVRRDGDRRPPVGVIPRPLGWFTGQEAVTRTELDRQFRERRQQA